MIWECNICSLSNLPFAKTNDNDYLVNILGFDNESLDFLKNVSSFKHICIQTLIDQLPGEHFATNEFLSNSITSKYYTPAEFIHEKFPKNKFSMIHLNSAALSPY